jgi:hypothetical protein
MLAQQQTTLQVVSGADFVDQPFLQKQRRVKIHAPQQIDFKLV